MESETLTRCGRPTYRSPETQATIRADRLNGSTMEPTRAEWELSDS